MQQPAWQLEGAAAPCALARRSSALACCGLACGAFEAPLRHAARRSSTANALQRSCLQVASPLPCALQPHVEMDVGLAVARDVESGAANLGAVPSKARRARSHRCEMHTSACRCRNVQWSCLCSALEMCVGVCTVGVCVLVLARACARVLRRRCRTSLLAPETARPFSSCRTAGPRLAREGTRHGRSVHGAFFWYSCTRMVC